MIKITRKTEANSSKEAFGYAPALLHKYESGWIIEFKYYHPETHELIAHRIRVQRERTKIKNDRLAELEFLRRCKKINKDLSMGWTPIGSAVDDSEEGNMTIAVALDLYFKKNREILRKETERSYFSTASILLRWLDENGKKSMTLADMDARFFIKFHDYLLEDRNISNRTFNNYIGYLKAMFNWLKTERQLEFINPFAGIKKKKEKKVQRDIMPDEWLRPIIDYCQKKNPVFEMVINMIYSSFIRPLEICRCQIKDVDFKNGIIRLGEDATKTDEARIIILKERTIEIMIENGISKADPESYLIGKEKGDNGKLFIGSKVMTHTRKLDRNWDAMRTDLKMPKQYQLYPFKHKGISYLRTIGYSREDISTISGHSCADEVETYTTDHARIEIAKRISNDVLSINEVADNLDEKRKNKKVNI